MNWIDIYFAAVSLLAVLPSSSAQNILKINAFPLVVNKFFFWLKYKCIWIILIYFEFFFKLNPFNYYFEANHLMNSF